MPRKYLVSPKELKDVLTGYPSRFPRTARTYVCGYDLPCYDDWDNELDPIEESSEEGWNLYHCAEFIQSQDGDDTDVCIKSPVTTRFDSELADRYIEILREMHPDIRATIGYPRQENRFETRIATGNQHLNYLILVWVRSLWCNPQRVFAAVYMYERGEEPRDVYFWTEVGFHYFKHVSNRNRIIVNGVFEENLKECFYRMFDSAELSDSLQGDCDDERYIQCYDILTNIDKMNYSIQSDIYKTGLYMDEAARTFRYNMSYDHLKPRDSGNHPNNAFFSRKSNRNKWYAWYKKSFKDNFNALQQLIERTKNESRV